jgi:hypothetical protein
MEGNALSYILALIGLGTASGVDIVAERSFLPLGGGSHAVAALSGLADIGLMLAAFAIFPVGTAVGVIVAGAIGTAMLSKLLPTAPAFVILPAIVGAVATGVHFSG